MGRRRPGFLPGTPNWALKFMVSEVLNERPTGAPRRGPRPLPNSVKAGLTRPRPAASAKDPQ